MPDRNINLTVNEQYYLTEILELFIFLDAYPGNTTLKDIRKHVKISSDVATEISNKITPGVVTVKE